MFLNYFLLYIILTYNDFNWLKFVSSIIISFKEVSKYLYIIIKKKKLFIIIIF